MKAIRSSTLGLALVFSLGWVAPVSAHHDTNGCGPDNEWFDAARLTFILLDVAVQAAFQTACDRHDNCYSHGEATYCKNQAKCDDEFEDDLYDICDDDGLCEVVADLFADGVREFGDASQSGGCDDYDGTAPCTVSNLDVAWVDSSFDDDRVCRLDGSRSKPFRNFAQGLDAVRPGGEIRLAPGDYTVDEPVSKKATVTATEPTATLRAPNR